MTFHPTNIELVRHNVPDVLKLARQWVPWRLAYSTNGRPTKPPVDAHGRHADITNPQSWMSFEHATSLVGIHNIFGVGIALAAEPVEDYHNVVPLLGMDIDWKNCADPRAGKFPAHLRDLAQRMDSYTEYSPSHYGARILVAAKLPIAGGSKTKKWEDGSEVSLIQHHAYVTMTGMRLSDSREEVEERQGVIDDLFSEWWPKNATDDPLSTMPLHHPCEHPYVITSRNSAAGFVLDWSSRVSEEEIQQLITGERSTPEQVAYMSALWAKKADGYLGTDNTVSMYLAKLVSAVMWLAPFRGWTRPEQKAADFAVAFAKANGISPDRITHARVQTDIDNWRRFAATYS